MDENSSVRKELTIELFPVWAEVIKGRRERDGMTCKANTR